MKLSKKAKFISLVTVGVASTSIVAGTTSTLLSQKNQENSNVGSDLNNSLNSNNPDKITGLPSITDNNVKQTKPLIPSASNYFNAKLSSVNGPILFWDNTITGADWFGAERWSIDLTKAEYNNKSFSINTNGHNGWKRTWLNWDLDRKNNILYVLSSWWRIGSGDGIPQQNVLAIDATTGSIVDLYELKDITREAFFALSVLENGNVLVYAQQEHAASKSVLIDVKANTYKMNEGNLKNISKLPQGDQYSKSKNYLMNLIPIAPNRNLAMTYNLTSVSNSSGDSGAGGGTSQVEFILCDDNMNVVNSAAIEWQSPKLITNAITGTKNSKIWPQRDWYKLIDGRIVTVIYDKLVVIDPKDINNPKVDVSVLDSDKWVESWSFDTNENLFYKVKDDSKIKKVTLSKNSNNHTISQYYDLKNSPNKKISANANGFNLYNVYGYSGQIMLINTWFCERVNSDDYPKDDTSVNGIKQKEYGLAAAITDNKSSAGSGDSKGLLNTNEAFQKSADFSIEQNILDNKLPSEITRNDLSFIEDGFLTKNKTTVNGKLLYPPFVKSEIDDKSKSFKITANVDQIPWFVGDNKMPENIPPVKIVKQFTAGQNIDQRFSWKNVEDDYDFKNTLPSKLTVDDIKRTDPFIINVMSQKKNVAGENYPKLTYSLSDQNDDTGKVKVKAKYEYLPMDVDIAKENIKIFEQEKEYTIFKKSDSSKFAFVGGESETDIKKIGELKELQEANVLASSFVKKDKQAFLKFIDSNNTAGYPLSKMKITVDANDVEGTLKLTVDPKEYDSNLDVKTKTFTGFNKNSEYSLSFVEKNTNFNKKAYRPSDIGEELFFDNFIEYTGFNSNDLKLDLFANNNDGTLAATLTLVNDYSEASIKNNTPFVKGENNTWVAKHTISDFKTTDEFNKDYQLIFKTDNDESLMKVKELTPTEIFNAFKNNNKNVSLGSQSFKDKFEFVNNTFVKSLGSKMPKIEDGKNIKIDLFPNNSGGELTIKIVFDSVPGYHIPLTFIQTFTGFAKGNDVVTQDVLVLKNQMQLENTLSPVLSSFPSQVKNHLEKNKKDISHFFTTTPTGDYDKAIKNDDFELLIDADDVYGTLIITIRFQRESIVNSQSLLEYSQKYENLKHY